MSTTTVFGSPTALGAKIITVSTTVTNTSGSYTGTVQDERLTSSMKAIKLELSNPAAFDAVINVVVSNGYLTISCADVSGTSTVVISVIKVADDPTAISSTEFDVLANRIGDLDDLETTAQTDLVSAVNENTGAIAQIESTISQMNTGVFVVALDTVTNTSGSYTHTTTVSGMTGDLKCVKLECSDPTIFRDVVEVTSGSNSVTLTCSNVAGSSTVTASFLAVGNGNPLSSSEYAALDTRIGQLADLDTTDKSSVVDAINEVKSYKEGVWNNFTTPASSGITFYNDSTATSGYIIRSGFCFVNVSMSIDAAIGDTSKAVVSGLPASLKNTIKPPSWSSFSANNIHAESLLQSNTLYIRNASVPTSGRWNISFVYPVA